MSEKSEILKKKLLYRASYRGTKEMDILLSNFVKKNMDNFVLIFPAQQNLIIEIFYQNDLP